MGGDKKPAGEVEQKVAEQKRVEEEKKGGIIKREGTKE